MKKLIFVILFVLLHSGNAFAAPRLNFSDLVSGPKTGLNDGQGSGVIVTVWGNDLGSTQGTSKVYVGNVEATKVYYWGNADTTGSSGPANLYARHKMQTISFSVPATAVDGSNTIKVTVNSVDSNTLPFTVRTGKIYHVKTTGVDNSTCGSFASPCRQANYVMNTKVENGYANRVIAGDTVYVHDGVQDISQFGVGSPDRNIGILLRGVGTASNPIGLIAYPGAHVLAQGINGGLLLGGSAYTVISKYTAKVSGGVAMQGRGDGINPGKYARVIANEVTNAPGGCPDGAGGAITGGAYPNGDQISDMKVYGNYIHDWGCVSTSKFHHTTYFSNRSGSTGTAFKVVAPELSYNYLLNNLAVHGLHVYDENGTGNGQPCGDFTGILNITNNVVENQRGVGMDISGESGSDASCFTMDMNVINNLFINTGKGPDWSAATPPNTDDVAYTALSFSGIKNTGNLTIANNTVYGSGDTGNTHVQAMSTLNFSMGSGPRALFGGHVTLRNNIFVDTNNQPFVYKNPDISAAALAAIFTASDHNLWFANGHSNAVIPAWDTSPITLDPKLDASYELLWNSPALKGGDDGILTKAPYDILGRLRKTGFVSIGAFTYTSNGTPNAPLNFKIVEPVK